MVIISALRSQGSRARIGSRQSEALTAPKGRVCHPRLVTSCKPPGAETTAASEAGSLELFDDQGGSCARVSFRVRLSHS